MGTTQPLPATMSPKWQSAEVLYKHIYLRVEVTIPPVGAVIFPNYMRKRYGCHFIDFVEAGAWNTVIIHATDCTPLEAAEEYRHIVNKLNGHGETDEV